MSLPLIQPRTDLGSTARPRSHPERKRRVGLSGHDLRLSYPRAGDVVHSASIEVRAALASGNYSGTFRILSDGANPATITVPLVVNPPGPHLRRWAYRSSAAPPLCTKSPALKPGFGDKRVSAFA